MANYGKGIGPAKLGVSKAMAKKYSSMKQAEPKTGGAKNKKADPEGGSYQTYLSGLRRKYPEATGEDLKKKKLISSDYVDTYNDFYKSFPVGTNDPKPTSSSKQTEPKTGKKQKADSEGGSYQTYLSGLRRTYPKATGEDLKKKKLISDDYVEVYNDFYKSFPVGTNDPKPKSSSKQVEPKTGKKSMLDADGDGDTVFNDSNNDGTMFSRFITKAREGSRKSDAQALKAKNYQQSINNKFKRDISEKGFIEAFKQNFKF